MEDINQINILELTGKIQRPEGTLAVRLMQENLSINNMLSDIGKLQYTTGYNYSQTGLFMPLTVPFCDSECDRIVMAYTKEVSTLQSLKSINFFKHYTKKRNNK